MDAGQMNWQKEPMLRTQHLHGSMTQHKGRLIIVGGNGDWQNQDGLVLLLMQLKQRILGKTQLTALSF